MRHLRHTNASNVRGVTALWLSGLGALACMGLLTQGTGGATVLWIILGPALVASGAAEAIEEGLRSTIVVSRVRGAIRRGELLLHYQPKVELDCGDVRGAEALVRWNHPRKGMIAPNDFVPQVEGSWLARRFNGFVLGEAIRQAAAWRRDGLPLRIAVNVSPNCLSPQLVEDICGLLDHHGLPARLLELEVTERGALDVDTDACAVSLDRLKALGVAVSLDDFGIGQSSLARLVALPVDLVKIDRSFIIPMLEDPMRSEVVRSAISLAHGAGFRVVAEGVESAEHTNILRRFGADVAQGFHISRPLEPDALVAWVDRQVGVVHEPDDRLPTPEPLVSSPRGERASRQALASTVA